MGVQRAEPIDLSAGNEPLHMNEDIGDKSQVFMFMCGRAAGCRMAASRFPSHCRCDSYLMVNTFVFNERLHKKICC